MHRISSWNGSSIWTPSCDAANRYFLPKNSNALHSKEVIKRHLKTDSWTAHYESGVAEIYLQHAAEYCRPIASTLAIHASSQEWDSILVWSTDPTIGRWAIADGALRISRGVTEKGGFAQQLVQNEDDGKKAIIQLLAQHETPLAIWEMKNLSVGTAQTAQVMEEILKRGQTPGKFPWKKCTTGSCSHHRKEVMAESKGGHDAGFDALSPPWILPSTSAADSQPTSPRKGLRSATAQGGTRLSYKELSSSFSEDGESVRGKRRNDSDVERPPPKKSKAGPEGC